MISDSGLQGESTVVDCAAYASGRRVGRLALEEAGEALTRTDQFVWVGLYEPDAETLEKVQRQFNLHDLAIEDARSAHQRPKIERYEDSLFVVLRTAQLTQTDLEFGETHVFVGPRYLVSVRHGSHRSHAAVRARCESTPELLSKGPAFVLHALMDSIVDRYFPVMDTLEDRLEDLEAEIFGDTMNRGTTMRIYNLRRELVSLKRAVVPLIDVCSRLTRYEGDLIPEDTRPYFRDVYDHVVRINEMIDTQRELLTTALDANLSLVSVQQNEHTKRLAAWAAMIAVPTMIAGIYGMNFTGIPELHWTYGYYFALAMMAIACGLLFVGFRKSGWL
jgi:magnesium transporter